VRRVETLRVGFENALARISAEINCPPVEDCLWKAGWVAGDGAVADGFGEGEIVWGGGIWFSVFH